MGNDEEPLQLRLPPQLRARIYELAAAADLTPEEVVVTALSAACDPDARKLQTLYLWCKAADGNDA